MIQKMILIIGFGIVALTAASCANQETRQSLSILEPINQSDIEMPAVPVASTPKFPPEEKKEGLPAINEQIPQYWEQLKQQFDIEVMMTGLGADQIFMTIRSYGDVEREISDTELGEIEKAIYDLVGEEFPLELGKQDCCAGTGITGEIKSIDENNRILVVSQTKKNGNTDNPEANWVTMTVDGKIYLEGEMVTSEELAVGQQVRYWSTGLVNQSYPGQTSAVKLEILE